MSAKTQLLAPVAELGDRGPHKRERQQIICLISCSYHISPHHTQRGREKNYIISPLCPLKDVGERVRRCECERGFSRHILQTFM